ncbi:MAG: hypothetical protein EPN22_07675 [Nitrospirae bacterium]|nr:MAG: hypothetical protein EPN22_07675 [Nitrospirota bacterium]
MGLASEKAELYNEAITALKLYLATNPESANVRKAQDQIYIIEAKKEKAAKESSPAAIAEKKKNEEEEFIKKLNGSKWWRVDTEGAKGNRFYLKIEETNLYHCFYNATYGYNVCNWNEGKLSGKQLSASHNN